MKKLLLLCSLLAISLEVSYAQTTALSAIVVDSDSTTWANGTWSIAWTPGPSSPNISAYTVSGTPLSQTVAFQNGTLNGSGTLAVTVYDSSLTTPTGSGYALTLCSNTSAPCSVYSLQTAGASQNISAALTASITAPRFKAVSGAYGYVDGEATVQIATGATYWNVTSSTSRCYTGSAWVLCSTGGGGPSSLIAGTNITISPASPCTSGSCTINSSGGGGASLPTGQLGQSIQNSSSGTNTYTASFASPFYGTNGCRIMGDSWLVSSIKNYLIKAFGGICTDYAVSGSMAPDEAINQFWPNVQPNYTRTPSIVIEAGVNDANSGGVPYEQNYQQTLQGMVAGAAIPPSNKVWGNNCTVTGAGGASLFTTIPGIQGSQSTTNGTIWTCTVGGGTKVDVAWWASDSNGGVASLSVDGQGCPGGLSTLNAFGLNSTAIATVNGTTTSIFDTQCTVTTSSSHSVIITTTSATGAGNKFAFIFAGTPYLSTGVVSPPPVYVVGVPFQNVDAKSATTAAFNTIANTIVTTYSAEGLPVQFVNLRGFVNSTTDMQTTVSVLNGYQVTDGACTAASTTCSSATANFGPAVVPSDCNAQSTFTCWQINIPGAGVAGAGLNAVIVGYTDQSHVIIFPAATTTVSGATVTYGPPGSFACGGNVSPLHANNCSGFQHVGDAFNAAIQPGNVLSGSSPQFNGVIQNTDVAVLNPSFYTTNVPTISNQQSGYATIFANCPTGTQAIFNTVGTVFGVNMCTGTSNNIFDFFYGGTEEAKMDRTGTQTSQGSYISGAVAGAFKTTGTYANGANAPVVDLRDAGATAATCRTGAVICSDVHVTGNPTLFDFFTDGTEEAYLDRAGSIFINQVNAISTAPTFPFINLSATLANNVITKIQDPAATAATCASNGDIFCVNVAGTSNQRFYEWFDNATMEAWIDRQGQGFLNLNLNTPLVRLGASGAASCTAGTGGVVCATEGTAFTNVAGTAGMYADSTAHEFKAKTAGASIAGLMVRAQPGSVRLTAQTASVATATLCASAAGACNVAGTYHVHFALYQSGSACSVNTTNGVSVQLTWTDGNGTVYTAQTMPMITNASLTGFATSGVLAWGATTLGNFGSIDFNIDTNGSIIQYATTYANCTTGTATYAISGLTTRLQ